MELVKSIVVDFCLFSLVEGFILCEFYKKICKLNKFKFNEIFILSLINCLISTLLPPVFYQIIIILWIGIFLKIFRKIKYITGFKYGLLSMIFILVTEAIILFILESLNLKVFLLNNNIDYIYFVFIKIFQFIIIKIIKL